MIHRYRRSFVAEALGWALSLLWLPAALRERLERFVAQRRGRGCSTQARRFGPARLGALAFVALWAWLAVPAAAWALPQKICPRIALDFEDAGNGETYWNTSTVWAEADAAGMRVRVRTFRVTSTGACDWNTQVADILGFLDQTGCAPSIETGSSTKGCYLVELRSYGDPDLTVGATGTCSATDPGCNLFVWNASGQLEASSVYVAGPLYPDGTSHYDHPGAPETVQNYVTMAYAYRKWGRPIGAQPGQGDVFTDDKAKVNLYMTGDGAVCGCAGWSLEARTCLVPKSTGPLSHHANICLPDVSTFRAPDKKFVMGHQWGHVALYLPGALAGTPLGLVRDCSYPAVGGTDQTHHIESREWSGCALAEGFAHFVAADIFNDHASADGVLTFWEPCGDQAGGVGDRRVKLESGGFDAKCSEKYLDTKLAGGTSTAGQGNELDWLRFFWDYYTDPDASSGGVGRRPTRATMLASLTLASTQDVAGTRQDALLLYLSGVSILTGCNQVAARALPAARANGIAHCSSTNPNCDVPDCTCGANDLRVGSAFPVLRIARSDATAPQLASQVRTLSAALGATGVSSDAEAWANAVLSAPEPAPPMGGLASSDPSVVAHYNRHESRLKIEARSSRSWRPLSSSATADPAGIGYQKAVIRAADAYRGLRAAGGPLAGSRPVQVADVSTFRHAYQASSTAPVQRAIVEYSVKFRPHACGLEVLADVLEVGVRSDGKLVRVEVMGVDVQQTGTVTTTRTPAQARQSFVASVSSEASGSEVVVSHEKIAYALHPRERTGQAEPRYVARYFHRAGSMISRSKIAALPLSSASPTLERLAPWEGLVGATAQPPPGEAEGRTCTSDSECASGRCFAVAGVGGLCSTCRNDSDCSRGGCTVPNLCQPASQAGAFCGDGSLGSGCQSHQACMPGLKCATVGTTAGGSSFGTCGRCTSHAECGSQERCLTEFDWASFRAFKTCVPLRSRDFGETCESNSDCAGGRKCVPNTFPDGSSVRVCAECGAASDCVCGGACLPLEFTCHGFEGGVCEFSYC